MQVDPCQQKASTIHFICMIYLVKRLGRVLRNSMCSKNVPNYMVFKCVSELYFCCKWIFFNVCIKCL